MSIDVKEPSIEDKISQLCDRLEKIGEEPVSPVHIGRRGSVAGAWLNNENDKSTFYKAMIGDRGHELPRGYKKGVWKSYGHYLREGIFAHNQDKGGNAAKASAFGTKYGSVFKVIAGMQEGVGAEGGFTILPEFAPDIYDRNYENDLLSRTDSFTVSGNRMTFPRTAETSRVNGQRAGGLQSFWTGEGIQPASTMPTLANTELRLKKLMVIVYLTDELIEDNAYALEQWVNRKVAEEVNFMTGDAIVNGTGGGQPTGILASAGTIAINRAGAGAISPADLVGLWQRRNGSMPASNLVWLINQDVEPILQLMALLTGAGPGEGQTMVYLPPGGFSVAPYATLMGRPVIVNEFCDTMANLGSIILADLKQYVTITKGGLNQATSTHVEFLTDQLALRFTLRMDGRPYEEVPITPYKGTNTQSAFVALDVP